MKSVKYFIYEHYLICILGALLALMVVAPLIAFPLLTKESYRGVNIAHFGGNAHVYLARAKDALEGHYLGNPIIREGKDKQSDYYFSMAEHILMAPFRILGLADKVNVVTIYNIYNFVGIFVLILLIYFLMLQFSRDKFLAIASTLFVIGGYTIIFEKTLFYTDFNIFGRTMFPYVSSIVFFAYLLLLVKSLKCQNFKYTIFAGLLFGLLFYIYFYAWTFALVLNIVLILLYLTQRNFSAFKKMLLITGLGVIIGLYNVIRIILFMNAPAGEQFSYFGGSSYKRTPIFTNLGLATLILFAFFLYKKKKDDNIILLLALILAGWASLNQQIITGRFIDSNHYYWFFITPLSIVVGFYMVWQLLDYKQFRNIMFFLTLIIVFINTAGGQYKSTPTTWELKLYEQNYRPIIDTLNQDSRPGVILTDGDLNSYLFTIYTSHDLFWGTFANMNDNPIQRFKDALYVSLYLNKDARNNSADYLHSVLADKNDNSYYKGFYKDLEGYWSGLEYYDYKAAFETNNEVLVEKRQRTINILSQEYSVLARDSKNVKELLNKYGVNYIVWDKNHHPEWDLSVLGGLKEVASFNNIYLYRIEY